MQTTNQNRALQIAFPQQRQMTLRPSFPSKPVRSFSPASSYGIAPKPFLVSPGMVIPDRSAGRPQHRGTSRSAASIRQRELAAQVISIDLLRKPPVSAPDSDSHFQGLRPVARLGHRIAGWLRPAR